MPQIHSLNNRDVYSHNSGGSKLDSKVSIGFVSLKDKFLGLQMVFFQCIHVVLPLCGSSYKETSDIGLGLSHEVI